MLVSLIGPFPLSYNSQVPFFDYAFDGEIEVLSQSPGAIEVRNLDTGARLTVNGSGMSVNPSTGAMTGTVSGWSVRDPGGATVATVTGVSWGLSEMVGAIDALIGDGGDESLILGLLSRQAITIDARGATVPMRVEMPDGITSAITFRGSALRDDFRGSNGNDTILLGPVVDGQGNNTYASRGNDRIDFSGILQQGGWSELVYHRGPSGAITFDFDGASNTGSIVKSGVGTDTLVDFGRAMASDGGSSVFGTDGADRFNVTTAAMQWWMGITAGQGADRYTLNLHADTTVRLDFRGNWYAWNQAPQALDIDLSRGQVLNDGYGNAETITRSGDGRLEIHGTRLSDRMIGSAGREIFIPGGGNDVIDGGDGVDRLRYDRGEMTSGVNVDLGAGRATGSWLGAGFTHTISGIEEVRGTRERNDLLVGDNADNMLDGRGGDDRLEGRGGDDRLYGGAGDDLLIGGSGDDVLRGGLGNDTVWAGSGHDDIVLEDGNNEVWAGAGNDTLIGSTGDDILGGGADDDVIDARAGGQNQLWGGDGRDTLWTGANGDAAGGGWGDDMVQGGAGADTLMGGLGNDTVQGEGGADTLFLGMGDDQGYGGAGNDTLVGGPGFDQLWGGAGADRFEFWRGYGWNRVEDLDAGQGDVLALGAGMWRGTHGVLSAAQVVSTFGRVNAAGDAILDFAAANTTVVVVGAGSLDGLADSIILL